MPFGFVVSEAFDALESWRCPTCIPNYHSAQFGSPAPSDWPGQFSGPAAVWGRFSGQVVPAGGPVPQETVADGPATLRQRAAVCTAVDGPQWAGARAVVASISAAYFHTVRKPESE